MATNTLGFEIDGIPQLFIKRELLSGTLNSDDDIEYVNITSGGAATKAIRLLNKFYMFNFVTSKLEEEDIVDEGVEIINVDLSNVLIHYKESNYIRQFSFDCKREDNQQNNLNQPISAGFYDASSITLKTHNFARLSDCPRIEDIIFYKNEFWRIEETYLSFLYTPRESSILHLKLNKLRQDWNN